MTHSYKTQRNSGIVITTVSAIVFLSFAALWTRWQPYSLLIAIPLMAILLLLSQAINKRVGVKPTSRIYHLLFTRAMWINMIVVALLIVTMAIMTNTYAPNCYRARIERYVAQGDIDRAMSVGRLSMETDAKLTQARAKMLDKRHLMGEKLFQYPVAGNGANLLQADTTADYRLCALLIDRKLEQFARTITHYYNVSDSQHLPRHYREALVLYQRLKSNPIILYRNAVTEEDYNDMLALEQKYPNPNERHLKVMLRYHGSYWYYYKWKK